MGTQNKTIDTEKGSKPKSQDDKPAADDGPLDSIGKAITDPLTAGADDEELHDDGRIPESPGG